MAKKKTRKSRLARTKTVYRDANTGLLLTKAAADKLPESQVIVETMATSGNKPAHTRTVYRNTLTGALISKAEALELAATAYTVEQMPIPATHPSLVAGLNIDLTGNWGESPSVTVDKGSNEKRGTVRVQAGLGATATVGWTLTFKHPKHAAPFAIVQAQKAAVDYTFSTTRDGLIVNLNDAHSNPTSEIVFGYLVTD